MIDFGLARPAVFGVPAPGAPTVLANTEPGTVLGTIGYMSPEQVRGEEIDARSDIFSLGCVLYEMLTGQQAFLRRTSAETLAAILRDQPSELSGASAAMPSNIEPVVRRCLEKDRNQRFQSASDLAFALRALPTATTSQRAAVPIRWNWRWIAAVAGCPAGVCRCGPEHPGGDHLVVRSRARSHRLPFCRSSTVPATRRRNSWRTASRSN